MSKYKDHYLPSEELEEFENIFDKFLDKIGDRYACSDRFHELISDSSLGWGEGIKIKEIYSHEKFYATRSDFYEFYEFLKTTR